MEQHRFLLCGRVNTMRAQSAQPQQHSATSCCPYLRAFVAQICSFSVGSPRFWTAFGASRTENSAPSPRERTVQAPPQDLRVGAQACGFCHSRLRVDVFHAWPPSKMHHAAIIVLDSWLRLAADHGLLGLAVALTSGEGSVDPDPFLPSSAGGHLYVFGRNQRGQLGLGPNRPYEPRPTLLPAPLSQRVTDVVTGGDHTAFFAGTHPAARLRRPSPNPPPPYYHIENKDALMPDCGVHYLWFAFVCFLIRSPPRLLSRTEIIPRMHLARLSVPQITRQNTVGNVMDRPKM